MRRSDISEAGELLVIVAIITIWFSFPIGIAFLVAGSVLLIVAGVFK